MPQSIRHNEGASHPVRHHCQSLVPREPPHFSVNQRQRCPGVSQVVYANSAPHPALPQQSYPPTPPLRPPGDEFAHIIGGNGMRVANLSPLMIATDNMTSRACGVADSKWRPMRQAVGPLGPTERERSQLCAAKEWDKISSRLRVRSVVVCLPLGHPNLNFVQTMICTNPSFLAASPQHSLALAIWSVVIWSPHPPPQKNNCAPFLHRCYPVLCIL